MFPSLNEYLKLLYKYCGKAYNKSIFVQIIFENIIFNGNDEELSNKIALFRMDDNNLLKIFNGKKIPSNKNLRDILSDIDKIKFRDFVNESTTEDTRILLAKDFERYIGQASYENIGDKLADLFVSILNNLVSNKNQKPTASISNFSPMSLEEELTEIVKTLSKLPEEKLDVTLSFEPVKVEEKISSEFPLLKREIKKDVIEYYRYLEEVFQNESDNHSLFFDNLAVKIKQKFDSLIEQNFPQEAIFDEIVSWIQKYSNHRSRNACRIIASFFVQNCEVFYAITK